MHDKLGSPCLLFVFTTTDKSLLHAVCALSACLFPCPACLPVPLVLVQVPRTYFPMRPGNRITLYHDSTCVPGPVEGISLAGGGLYSEHSCWDDLYDAIMQADRWGGLLQGAEAGGVSGSAHSSSHCWLGIAAQQEQVVGKAVGDTTLQALLLLLLVPPNVVLVVMTTLAGCAGAGQGWRRC